jgi:hypothetical protein
MTEEEGVYISQCGRQVSAVEVEEIRQTVEVFWRLSRWELAQAICEHLGWHSASGSNKVDASMKLLERLESLGQIRLPGKRKYTRLEGRGDCEVCDCETEPGAEVVGSVRDVGMVSLEVVLGKEATGLWNGYVSRYHYLRHKRPFGNYRRIGLHHGSGSSQVDGSEGSLDRLERESAAEELGMGDQQHAFFDFSLGESEEPGQSCIGSTDGSDHRGLVCALEVFSGIDGELCGSSVF